MGVWRELDKDAFVDIFYNDESGSSYASLHEIAELDKRIKLEICKINIVILAELMRRPL